MAVYPDTPGLLAKFCVEDNFGETHQLAKWVKGKLHIPRAVCPLPTSASSVWDKRAKGAPIKTEHKVKPRNKEQRRVIAEATELLLNGESFQLQASTGFGKTVIAMPMIAAVARKTIIIVPKEDLVVQWYEALQEFLDLRRSEIGLIQGNTYNVEGKKVVIAMLKSVALGAHKYPSTMAKEFGFQIIDEVHSAAADQMCAGIPAFHSKIRMGLSATPQRKDGMECINQGHIGEVRVVAKLLPMKPHVVMWPTDWQCPRWGDKRAAHSPGKCAHIIKSFTKDRARIELAATFGVRAYKDKRNTVVFSEHLDLLQMIKARMLQMGVPVQHTADYVGGMSQKQRDLAAVKPLIFATYGMMSTGTNIPWLDACIFTSPRSDIEQIIGRICRESDGKRTPVAIDLVDLDSYVFKGYARKRLQQYEKMGAEVDCRVDLD